MKLRALNPVATGKNSRDGFTFVEIMTVTGIFSLAVGAMVSLQLFGLRIYTLGATKIVATTGGREFLNDIRDQIRSAQIVYVGTYSNDAFSIIPLGTPQIGNALEIFSTTNTTATNNATIFYMDPASNVLNMVSGGVVSPAANYVTNYFCMQAEDCYQNILTNYVANPVICINMQFYQWEYPVGYSGGTGSNAACDFYRLRTRIARRS